MPTACTSDFAPTTPILRRFGRTWPTATRVGTTTGSESSSTPSTTSGAITSLWSTRSACRWTRSKPSPPARPPGTVSGNRLRPRTSGDGPPRSRSPFRLSGSNGATDRRSGASMPYAATRETPPPRWALSRATAATTAISARPRRSRVSPGFHRAATSSSSRL